MEKEPWHRVPQGQEERGAASSPSPGKQPWQEPKLTFVEPKLTKHGELGEVTGQFLGQFSP